jgi:hypothetical protein
MQRQQTPLHALPPKPARETAEAHAAKLEYAHLGPGRTLEKLVASRVQSASQASQRLATFKRWSAQFQWQEFVKQWDAEQATKKQQVALESQEKLNEQQSKIAQDASMRVWKRLNDLLALDEQAVQQMKTASPSDERPTLLVSPANLISYFRITADLARTAVGAANTITQQQHTGQAGGAVQVTLTLLQQLDQQVERQLQTWRSAQGFEAPDLLGEGG